mmetsp:Transcript_19698/g.52609  ORF Transcript_19698/g.52609 Transcript_19698/m.52609 type:complete len:167 (-) Transcript_19698:383-883(-)
MSAKCACDCCRGCVSLGPNPASSFVEPTASLAQQRLRLDAALVFSTRLRCGPPCFVAALGGPQSQKTEESSQEGGERSECQNVQNDLCKQTLRHREASTQALQLVCTSHGSRTQSLVSLSQADAALPVPVPGEVKQKTEVSKAPRQREPPESWKEPFQTSLAQRSL